MIDNFEEILSGAKSVAISGHVRPDGDCVGSCLSMYNYLIKYYPSLEVVVYLETIPTVFRFLKGADKIRLASEEKQDRKFDLFIALDCSEGGRLGDSFVFFESAKTTICIDHHFSNQSFATYNYIIPDDSSTCELVYNQLPKDRIDKDIAECLYTGIIHDTGIFQYSCTSKATMEAAGYLMTLGIDYSKICDDTYYAKTMVQNRVMGEALLSCKTFLDGKIVAAVMDMATMEKYGALPRHLEGIVQQLRCTTGVEVAVFLYETEPGQYKGSTRATGDVDLTKICGAYGGGGHKKASGFSVSTLEPWTVVDEVCNAVEKELKELGVL